MFVRLPGLKWYFSITRSLRAVRIIRFCLDGGVGIIRTISVLTSSAQTSQEKADWQFVRAAVRRGERWCPALARAAFLPPRIGLMLISAECEGTFDQMLPLIENILTREFDILMWWLEVIDALSMVLVPAALLAAGLYHLGLANFFQILNGY